MDSWVELIHTAQADEFWFWSMMLLGAGLACGYGIFHYIRRSRIIEDTPTCKVRSAPQGYVEIIGTMQYLANQPVLAPLTKQSCVWFSFRIEKKVRRYTGKSSRTTWETVEEQFSQRPFQCVDDTGLCMINPMGAEIYPSAKDVWYGSEKWPVYGPAGKSGLFSGRYRYTEKRLNADDPLYAIGKFQTIDPNKARGDVSSELRAVLNVWKKDQDKLLSEFDRDSNGQIDLEEWELVRKAAEEYVYNKRLERADRPAINILSRTGDFRRPYILSVKPQHEMVRGFRVKAAACTAGFVLLAPVSIWMLFVRLST